MLLPYHVWHELQQIPALEGGAVICEFSSNDGLTPTVPMQGAVQAAIREAPIGAH